MCGILGYSGNSIQEDTFSDVLSLVSHRGPDDCGIKSFSLNQDKKVYLGHRRLSIIDLSELGRQPMSDDCEEIWISYNGEIYNFLEIKDSLLRKGYSFKSRTDTEVLIYLYKEYGFKMLTYLNGIFAFTILDLRKKIIFAARDHFGIKPFYYYYDKNCFIFASEIKAILAFKGINTKINPQNLFNYFIFLYCPAPDTAFEHIRKLEPGCYLVFDLNLGSLNIHKWWRWKGFLKDNVDISEGKVREILEEILFRVVKRQVISDVPVGFFLSGGLDSSTVVSLYKEVFRENRPDCFCISFKKKSNIDTDVDDVYYAKKVAAIKGANLEQIEVDPDIIKLLPEVIYYLDEPQGDPAIINVKLISAIARERGFKVLLSGAGGDDIFTGYRRHQLIYLKNQLGFIPSFLTKSLSKFCDSVPMNGPFMRRTRRFLELFSVDMKDAIVQSFNWMPSKYINSLMKDISDYSNPLSSKLELVAGNLDPIHQVIYLESLGFLPDHNLNYTDKMGMAEGVEIRVPFLDRELAEFVGRLSSRFKIRRGQTKYILKKVMEKYLPKDIIYRPKVGFMAPLREWIRADLKPLIKEHLVDSPPTFLNPERVRSLIKDNEDGRVDGSYTIYQILVTKVWMERFGVSI